MSGQGGTLRKVQAAGISGEPGPPCRTSRIGLRRSVPRIEIHCRIPSIGTYSCCSIPCGETISLRAEMIALTAAHELHAVSRGRRM